MDELEDQNIRSKFFIKLHTILEKRRHQHMIWLVKKNKFQVKMVDKKNKAWEKEDISLFKELDFLYERDKHLEKYPEICKGRFKANISKLRLSNYIKAIDSESKKVSTSVTIKTYEILKFLPNGVSFPKSNVLKKKSFKSIRKEKKMEVGPISEMESAVCLKDINKTDEEWGPNSKMELAVDLKDRSKTEKEWRPISEIESAVDLKEISSKTEKLQMYPVDCNLKGSVDPLLSSAGDILKWKPDTDLNINEDGILNTFKTNGTVFNPINEHPNPSNQQLLFDSETDLNIDGILKDFQTNGIAFDSINKDPDLSNHRDDLWENWPTVFYKIPEEEQK